MGVNTDLICSFSEILMAPGGAPLHLQWRARIGYGGFEPQNVEVPNSRLPNFGNSCAMTPGLSTGAVAITGTLVTDAESSAHPSLHSGAWCRRRDMHRLRRGEAPRPFLGQNSCTVVNNYREVCRGLIQLQRDLAYRGRRFLLPRFTPPKLTIAVGPAKLVETLGFCWGFETGHTHGKSAAAARRELFLRLDGPSARGHDFRGSITYVSKGGAALSA